MHQLRQLSVGATGSLVYILSLETGVSCSEATFCLSLFASEFLYPVWDEQQDLNSRTQMLFKSRLVGFRSQQLGGDLGRRPEEETEACTGQSGREPAGSEAAGQAGQKVCWASPEEKTLELR